MAKHAQVKPKPLFKRTATGAIQIWEVRVELRVDGTATIITTHGLVDGKKQEARDHIKEGKNPGKKNETTAVEQAIKEAVARWTYQRDRRHYGLTVEESDAKRAVAPMLAHKYEDHAAKINWEHAYAQPKFDGHRAIIFRDANANGDIMVFSRKGELIESVGHLFSDLKSIMPKGSSLDGELYVHGLELRKISSLIRRKQEDSIRLCYMAYDTMIDEMFEARLEYLMDQVQGKSGQIIVAETIRVESEKIAMEFQQQCLDDGYEGAILRHGDTGYEPGKRSQSLLKMKTFLDAEFVIVGCTEGRGSHSGMAVFTCVTEDGNQFKVTAPGTHEEKKEAWENHANYIGKKLTVKYQMFTTTGKPVPFLPVAKGLAD